MRVLEDVEQPRGEPNRMEARAVIEASQQPCHRSKPKRAALLCSRFPPIGGGGTPRSAKFVKYLARFGYEPTVFTVDPESHSSSREFQLDTSQLEDLEKATYELVRVPHPPSSQWWKWARRLRLYSLLRAAAYRWRYEDARPWSMEAARTLVALGSSSAFDLIYASAGPNSTLEAGAWAARQLGIPWVADLRDLWTQDSLRSFPSALHYRWEVRFERRLLRSAGAIIANTPLSGERLRSLVGQAAARRVVVIPNGFDPADFQVGGRVQTPPRSVITLVHAGTLYEPGSAPSRVGTYRRHELNNDARSTRPIVEALQALRGAAPELAGRIRVRLLGFTPPGSRRLIRSEGLGDQIVCEGLLPRDDAMEAMRGADALVVLQVAYADAAKPVPYIPGKIYDCLAAGTQIFAPIPRGDLWELLQQAPQAHVCDYRDPGAMATCLEAIVNSLDESSTSIATPDWLHQFDRYHLTQRLADLFDRVLQRGG